MILACTTAVPPGDEPASEDVCHVLVVDDSRAQRRILSACLEKWGYSVLEADSGAAALEMCRTHQVDIIISDWMMPGMSGLELCQAYRRLDIADYGYFILLTSRSGKDEIAHGLDAGADDFLSKPVAASELRARIRAGARLLKTQRQLAEKNRLVSETLAEIRSLYDALERDLIEAKSLQQSLIQDREHEFGAARVSLLFRPAGHIGGDLVGVFPITENRIGLFAIDVSGHGIASALMTARLAAYFSATSGSMGFGLSPGKASARALRSPAEAARRLNRMLLRDIGTDIYFTMSLVYFHLRTGRAVTAQCGHPHTAVQRSDGRVEFHGQGGFPVGLFPEADWEEHEFRLHPGDRMLITSDGITECPNTHGEMFGEVGIVTSLCRNAGLGGPAFLDALLRETMTFARREDLEDDVSALLLEYRGAAG